MNEYKIECYKNNKLIYRVELYMSEHKLLEQLKENKLQYTHRKVNGTEIIYLDQFDRIIIKNNN